MNPLNSLAEYEAFIYGLPQQFPALSYSTLLVARRGASTALVRGELIFSGGVRSGAAFRQKPRWQFMFRRPT